MWKKLNILLSNMSESFFQRYQKLHGAIWPLCPDGKPDPEKEPIVSVPLYAEACMLRREISGNGCENMSNEAAEAYYVLHKYIEFVDEHVRNAVRAVPEPAAPDGIGPGARSELVTLYRL